MKTIEEYLKEVGKRSIHKDIYIYGAGRKGIGLLRLVNDAGFSVRGFLVTNGHENKKEEKGLPVTDIHTSRLVSEETLILIGIRERWIPDVIETLKREGYKDYLEPPEGIEYLLEGDLDRSRHAVLQITTQIGCKIDCRYCPQETFIKRYREDKSRELSMAFADYKLFVDRTDPNVIIDFAGFSEPFFHPDAVEMMKYAHEMGHPVELFTTLVGLDRGRFDLVKGIPFREVVLHIPDKESNSKIPITDEYLDLLKTVLDTKKPDGCPFADWGSCHGEIADEVQELIDGRLRVITQLHDRAGNLTDGELERQVGKRGPIRCSNTEAYYHNHNVLLPDGTVGLCDSDWGMKHVLGNLKEQSYAEILNGTESREIRSLRESEDGDVICRKCCYAVSCGTDHKA